MPDIRYLLNVSRPRFWLYVFGPYLVGLISAASAQADLFKFEHLIFAVFFLFPANLLIYGINDIFDYETDRNNPKKTDYETLVTPEKRRMLLIAIALTNLPFIIAAICLTPAALPALAGFLFFSVFYSAPPIRAKTKPIIDSAFNILYVFPAIFSYQMLTGSFPPLAAIIAAGLWTTAMHAYSAVPDIEADRSADISTVATLLGKNGTLIFCLILYLASAAIAYQFLGSLSIILGIVYAAIIAVSFRSNVFYIYRYFPILNAIVGFILFWAIAIKLIK